MHHACNGWFIRLQANAFSAHPILCMHRDKSLILYYIVSACVSLSSLKEKRFWVIVSKLYFFSHVVTYNKDCRLRKARRLTLCFRSCQPKNSAWQQNSMHATRYTCIVTYIWLLKFLYTSQSEPPHALFQVVPTQNFSTYRVISHSYIYYHLLFQLLQQQNPCSPVTRVLREVTLNIS